MDAASGAFLVVLDPLGEELEVVRLRCVVELKASFTPLEDASVRAVFGDADVVGEGKRLIQDGVDGGCVPAGTKAHEDSAGFTGAAEGKWTDFFDGVRKAGVGAATTGPRFDHWLGVHLDAEMVEHAPFA
ncbi:MAG: hypothetical protein RL235_403, partial [Chlamydiota bacterium]